MARSNLKEKARRLSSAAATMAVSRVAQGRVVKRISINGSAAKKINATITHSTKGPLSSRHGMVTRGVTATAARNAVFNTQELLENILLQLPAKDLFGVEAVCSHWHALVKTSPRLQRAKFLSQVKKYPMLWFDKQAGLVKTQDPHDALRLGADWLAAQTAIHTAQLNTLLFALAPEPERVALVDRCTTCETLAFRAHPDLAAAWKLHRAANAMFVCNPPTRDVEIEVAFAALSPTSGRVLRAAGVYAAGPERHAVERARGVTWADVVQEMDVVLHCANERRSRVPGMLKLVLDVKRCKLWMRGVVFLSGEEKGFLDAGGWIGKKDAVGEAPA